MINRDIQVKANVYRCVTRQLVVLVDACRVSVSVQLEGISSKQRCSKVNMGLARLYKMTGQDRSAVTAYKEVLRYDAAVTNSSSPNSFVYHYNSRNTRPD